MLKGSENCCHGASPHPNQHCKTQTGCRVPRREGLGPTGSHRAPPNPIWVPRREELGPTGSHRARFGSHRREELGPTGPHQVRIGMRARLVGWSAILGPKKVHASGFNIACLHSIIRMQSSYMPCLGKGKFCNAGPCRSKLRASYFSLVQQLARLGSCGALDWPAKRTTSGFVSGTVFWAET